MHSLKHKLLSLVIEIAVLYFILYIIYEEFIDLLDFNDQCENWKRNLYGLWNANELRYIQSSDDRCRVSIVGINYTFFYKTHKKINKNSKVRWIY